ncbi:hypothetical protein PVAG01_05986 [Phlyctema vagabunda]|uniref:Uncharacterized protein n=1 Tax=Phlyctema vagabunda TaxID=108571 RepID=A0ABR4PET1_9HELO
MHPTHNELMGIHYDENTTEVFIYIPPSSRTRYEIDRTIERRELIAEKAAKEARGEGKGKFSEELENIPEIRAYQSLDSTWYKASALIDAHHAGCLHIPEIDFLDSSFSKELRQVFLRKHNSLTGVFHRSLERMVAGILAFEGQPCKYEFPTGAGFVGTLRYSGNGTSLANGMTTIRDLYASVAIHEKWWLVQHIFLF